MKKLSASLTAAAVAVVVGFPAAAAAQDAGLTLTTETHAEYGDYLAGDGRPLYIFQIDQPAVEGMPKAESKCYDECAGVWPPVTIATGTPLTEGEVNLSLIGTTERTDGSIQVTYNGWPLYYYAADTGEDIKGHRLEGFGGEWHLIDVAGVGIGLDEPPVAPDR